MKLDTKIMGMEELRRKLQKVEHTLARQTLRRGVTLAAKPVLAGERALVRKRTGLTERSLGVKVKTYRGGQVVVALVGPRAGWGERVAVNTAAGPGVRLRFHRQKRGEQRTPGRIRPAVAHGEPAQEGRAPAHDPPGRHAGPAADRRRQAAPGLRAKPFGRPAMEANRAQVEQTLRATFGRGRSRGDSRRFARRASEVRVNDREGSGSLPAGADRDHRQDRRPPLAGGRAAGAGLPRGPRTCASGPTASTTWATRRAAASRRARAAG